MISEKIILALIICVAITLIGVRARSMPIIFISAVGVVIAAFMTYEQTGDILTMVLMLFAAISQIALIREKEASRWRSTSP